MPEQHVGYLDFNDRIYRFQNARSSFQGGTLNVEAEGAKCKLYLYGITFGDVRDISEVSERILELDSETIFSDPIAESGIETKSMWLSFQSLKVQCRNYDAQKQLITVTFQADLEDAESGRSGSADCTVRCSIVEKL